MLRMMAKEPSVAATGERGISVHPGGLRFEVHARPKASRSAICGARDGALDVRLAAPPVDGAANEELVRVIASALKIARRDVVLVRGATSKTKLVEVRGLAIDEVRIRLREATPAAK